MSRFTGLVAPPHTPFGPHGAVDPGRIEAQARHVAASGAAAVFVGGTNGECHSLSTEERELVAARWLELAPECGLRVIVHVGCNCLPDAVRLARHARGRGADAIAAMAPCYFKPVDVAALVEFLTPIAAAAPETPFYYYHIPAMTGVRLSVPELLRAGAERIPTLRGAKYTCDDLLEYRRCVELDGGRFDCLLGFDRGLLAGLEVGARGAVGSTYNFAAPLFVRLIAAFEAGDMESARRDQLRAEELIAILGRHDFRPACKALMAMIGVDCGPVRPPLRQLSEAACAELRAELEAIGFFRWSRPAAGA